MSNTTPSIFAEGFLFLGVVIGTTSSGILNEVKSSHYIE